MTRRDLAMVGMWAVAAFGVSLAAVSVGTVNGVEDVKEAAVETPTLKVKGLELSLRCPDGKRAVAEEGGVSVLAGAMVPIEFVARNEGKSEGVTAFEVVATVYRYSASNSRTSREVPARSWEFSSNVRVSPGNTVVAKLTPRLKVQEGESVQFTIRAGGEQIAATRFNVVGQLPDVVVAVADEAKVKRAAVSSELAKPSR